VIRSAFLLALLLPAAADEVTLADGSRLSGTVTALADGGQLLLTSDLSFEPFQLKAESLRRVDFATEGKSSDEHDALVVLANGDQLPADLAGIDAGTVTLRTSFAGEIRIPRESVRTIQLGVRPRKLIYRGPDDEFGWNIKSGWRFDSRRFTADNSGTVSREFDIPGSFALKFRVAWRNSPNVQVYFADDSLETTGKADRYYLQFGGSGLELKRQQSNEGNAYLSMTSIPGDPADFTDNDLDIELRVDRKLGLVHLYLDGIFEGKFPDPVKVAPSGKGIMFRSNLGGDDSQSIDNIEIREWDAAADRHRGEERGDEKQDVLITRGSDRSNGSILGLTEGKDGGTIRYKGPHHPEPVDFPLSEVSTLFFARPAAAAEAAAPPLKLGLRGRGSLGVTACTFGEEFITARHPLLGEINIRRNAVASLERAAETTAATDDETEEEEEE
jgi:hypothetical protein